jgi:hypothetical protein
MFLDVIVWLLVSTTLLLDSDERGGIATSVAPGALDIIGDAVAPDAMGPPTMMDMPWL